MRKLLLLGLGLGLAGCQSLTPAQQAALFCVVSADGVVIATATAQNDAKTLTKLSRVGPAQAVACDAATKVGAALTK